MIIGFHKIDKSNQSLLDAESFAKHYLILPSEKLVCFIDKKTEL